MKILIISGFFYPEITPRSFRTTELVKEFVRTGNSVTLYCPKQEFDYTEFLSEYPIKFVQYKEPRDSFIQSKSKLKWLFGRVLVHEMAYPYIKLLKIIPDALQNEDKDYDLLISIAVPHQIHWALGNLYSKGMYFAKTWIADCGDPYMLSKSTNRKKPFYFKWLEKRWCKACDFITVPTKGALEGYYPEFRKKIQIIPQAFCFEDIRLDEYRVHHIPTFAFSGGLIKGKRDIRPFIDKLLELKLNFKLYIYTHDFSFFDNYQTLIDKQIILSDFIPRLELLKRLSTMDFLLNLENGTSVQTPSKLIDYSLTKRPILSIDSNRIDEKKIIEFFKGDYSNQKRIDNVEQYNIKIVAKQIIDLSHHKS